MTQENAIVVRSETETLPSLTGMMSMAKTLIDSGFLPSAIKTPAQAVAIMMTGRELQIPTMQALRQINVIQGKPTMSAELMLALAHQRIPGFKCHPIESTATSATFEFQRPGQPAYRHTFTMNDAAGMGLVGKDNWKKQPAVMLRWRCISAGLRLIAPDAIAGLYTPEEIQPDIVVDPNTGTPVVTQNTPIAMPTEKTAAPADTQQPTQQPDPGDNQERPEPNVVRGEIEEISVKTSKEVDERTKEPEWIKYGVKIKGEFYGTFDKTHGQVAKDAKENGQAVEIEWQQHGKYKNLVGIHILAE